LHVSISVLTAKLKVLDSSFLKAFSNVYKPLYFWTYLLVIASIQ
jgi:hypothetical protein